MSGFSWILLNIVLIVGALYGTMKVRSAPPPKPLQLEEAVAANSQDAVQHKNAPRGADKNSGTPTAPSRALSTNASLDALWKQTLFLPTRTEDTGEDAAEQAAAEQAAFAANNIEFELVGIAQISTVDTSDPVPVAILRSKVGAASGQRGRRPPARGGGGRNNGPATPAEPSKNEERQVFRVGDKINQTGYLLTNIDADANMVEVTRNGETVKLYINFAGTEAMQRREAVSQETARRHQEQQRRIEQENTARQQAQATQAQAAQATPTANPGAPPGPPGPPGTPGSNTTSASPGDGSPANPSDARAERLRRIAEARQQRQARQQQHRHGGNVTPTQQTPDQEPSPPEDAQQ